MTTPIPRLLYSLLWGTLIALPFLVVVLTWVWLWQRKQVIALLEPEYGRDAAERIERTVSYLLIVLFTINLYLCVLAVSQLR